ncbi:MAG: hypothetical protein QM831_31520 [Kofleriaceae bacterium]
MFVSIGRAIGGMAWVTCVLCACVDKNELSLDRCAELRDHVIDLRLAPLVKINADPTPLGSATAPPPPVDIEKHRAALKQALGDDFTDRCMKNVSADQLNCALAGTDGDSLERCLTKK